MNIPDFANELPPVARLGALSGYLREESLAAPIDMYKRSVSSILSYGTTARLASCDFLGRLLVLGLISAAEGYFRGVLSSCIECCPLAQTAASDRTINLGGLLWHGKAGFSRSAFEHSSFSSKDELTRACKDYLGFKLDDAVFKSLLEQYDLVCQLRHGIVHGDGLLPGRNAVKLDIQRFKKPVRIHVQYMHLQDLAAVVTTLVATFNRELFFEMCKRWAVDWRRRADWEPANEVNAFWKIWNIFHSSDERKTRRGRANITRTKCLQELRIMYGL